MSYSSVSRHEPLIQSEAWAPPRFDDAGALLKLAFLPSSVHSLMSEKRQQRGQVTASVLDVLREASQVQADQAAEFWRDHLGLDGLLLSVAPSDIKSDMRLVEIACRTNGAALKAVPMRDRSKNLCLIAVTTEGLALGAVPLELRDEELCREAVSSNGLALGFVPDRLRSLDLCEMAVDENPLALKYVPHPHRSLSLCKSALVTDIRAIPFALDAHSLEEFLPELPGILDQTLSLSLEMIPPALLTRDLCLCALQQDGLQIARVPESLVDDQMRLSAVSQNGLALKKIAVSERNREICHAAIRNTGEAIYWTPPEFLDRDICLTAIDSYPRGLDAIPSEICDLEMVKRAAQKGFRSIFNSEQTIVDAIAARAAPLAEYEITLGARK